MKKAIVVLSGGLDSSTVLYIAKQENDEVFVVSFLYGQRHIKEIKSAKKIAKLAEVKEHRIIKLPTPKGNALTDKIEVPTNRTLEDMSKEIPKTEVAFRNQLFLTLACQYANEVKATRVYIGVTAIDYSGYPDCRPEFIEEFNKLIQIQQKDIKITAPLLQLYKAEIIDWGIELGVPYQYTWSCYSGKKLACGKCDSCLLRLKGFKEANSTDPIKYEI